MEDAQNKHQHDIRWSQPDMNHAVYTDFDPNHDTWLACHL